MLHIYIESLFISTPKNVYILISIIILNFYTQLINDFFDKFIVIFFNLNKNRQIIMKLKNLNEKNDEKTSEKLVFNIFHTIIIISNRSIILDFL